MILLIRHAEKLMSPEQGLTPQGFQDAIQYGELLNKKRYTFDEIVTSPIERCVQTAECIAKSLSCNVSIRKSQLLGDPGVFITDDQLAGSVFETFSVHEVINKMLNKETLAGFANIEDGSLLLSNEIKSNIRLKKSILYVSHDAVIMPFIAWQSSIFYIQKKDVVGYLGGFKVHETDNKSIKGSLLVFNLMQGEG